MVSATVVPAAAVVSRAVGGAAVVGHLAVLSAPGGSGLT